MFFKDTIRKSKFFPKQLYTNPYYKKWKKNINSNPKTKLKFQKIQSFNNIRKGREGKVFYIPDDIFYNSNNHKVSPYVVVKELPKNKVVLSRISSLDNKIIKIKKGLIIPFKYRYFDFNKNNGFFVRFTKKTKYGKDIYIKKSNLPKIDLRKEDYNNILGYGK